MDRDVPRVSGNDIMAAELTKKKRGRRIPTDRSGADTYTLEEYRKKLGVGRDVAYTAAAKGEIPVIKIGGRYLVPKALGDKMLGKGAEPKPAAEGRPAA
jgi:excisionase family DNA binding protein